jgi:hypothetical protein
MSYSDLDLARFIVRESEKIFDLMGTLIDDDENLSRSTMSTALNFVWNDLVSYRCELEEMLFDRMDEKV